MAKNSKRQGPGAMRQWRIGLGALAALNLIAAALVLFPPGGSAEDLGRQLATLQSQVESRQTLLERTREHAAAVEKGRSEGDEFLGNYFLERRTAYSTLLSELVEAANQSKIKPREHAYSTEPIEGSDSLSMMTITANYEGTYSDLMHFVHEIDRSPRLLIVESLNAAPQQGSNVLSVNMKLETFVREGGEGQ
jgi:type IV pilus assembly PilO-like protein